MRFLFGCVMMVLATINLSGAAIAQQGLDVPCVNCPVLDTFSPIYPEGGIWFNPEQSGTGFMFQVQNGRLAGYYYLYDETGQPMWLFVTGDLQPSKTEGVMWTLEADFERFEGGSCLNCDYQPPELTQSPGRIRFEFLERNLGRFSVDGALPQNIVPMTFGVFGSRPFESLTEYVVPELDGAWAFTFYTRNWPGSTSASAGLYGLAKDENATLEDGVVVRYFLTMFGDFPLLPDTIDIVGHMECLARVDYGPVCEIHFERGHPYLEGIPFVIRLANLGHRRFVAQAAESGFVLEAHRVGTD